MEDRQIVAQYWERNERAVDETAAKYGRYCFSIAKHILANKEDAEEAVNDTYLCACGLTEKAGTADVSI